MEAKDTVMKDEEIAGITQKILGDELPELNDYNWTVSDVERAIAQAQAEISFKAGQEQSTVIAELDAMERGYQAGKEDGIKEVVEWIETHQLIKPDKDSLTRFEPFYQIGEKELRKWLSSLEKK